LKPQNHGVVFRQLMPELFDRGQMAHIVSLLLIIPKGTS